MFKNLNFRMIQVLQSLRKRGLKDTILLIFYELYFDLKYKTETRKFLELSDLNDVKSSKINSERYQPIPYYYIRKLFLKFDHELKDSYFLDYGCGKGRALLLAAEFGAKVLYGVEFSKKLCNICERNLNKSREAQNYLIVNKDAVDYEIPERVNVIFFYNPFNKPILEKVIKKIRDSLEQNKRKITIIYGNPLYEDMFYQVGFHGVDKIVQKTGKITYPF